MNLKQWYLLLCVIAGVPVALAYGAMPTLSLEWMFDLRVVDVNELHLFRAIMGLYLGLIAFWFIAVFKVDFRPAALISQLVFLLGLVGGRLVSFVVDGMPNAVLTTYLCVEVLAIIMVCIVIKLPETKIS